MSNAPHFPLPISLEEITADWLTAALRIRAPGVTVRKVEIIDSLHTTTTKVRLKLDLDDAGKRAGIPELVILKGGFEAHSRKYGMANMHLKEVRGYRDVLPVLPLPSPTCYFADYDAERQQGIIIMEDLKLRGVTFCNALQPQSFEQVARRLTALARFHAKSWASPELAPGGRWGDLEEFLPSLRDFFDHCSSPENWKRFITAPRGAATSTRFHDRDWMIAAFDRMTRYSQTMPHCVLHGDIHLGNLYIDRDGTPGFYDTLASRGPGMLEVSYHISGSVDAADRAAWEGALVQRYLDELRTCGVDAPDFNEAMRQYGIFLMYGFFIWVTTESQYQPESVNTANAARVSTAMLDHDFTGLMKSLPD